MHPSATLTQKVQYHPLDIPICPVVLSIPPIGPVVLSIPPIGPVVVLDAVPLVAMGVIRGIIGIIRAGLIVAVVACCVNACIAAIICSADASGGRLSATFSVLNGLKVVDDCGVAGEIAVSWSLGFKAFLLRCCALDLFFCW